MTAPDGAGGRSALRLPSVADDPRSHLQIKEIVYRRLVRAIVELRLQPGEQLRERQLADRMGVSKTPIREALVRLEKEGLVTVTPYRGAIVRRYTRRDVREVYELRELLDGWCCRQAATRMSGADETELRANAGRSRALLAAGTPGELPALFDEFDRILHRQAAGHRIGRLIDELRLHLERFGRLTADVPGRLDASVRQHDAIVRAIAERDPEGAEHACREHVRSVCADLVAAVATDWSGRADPGPPGTSRGS